MKITLNNRTEEFDTNTLSFNEIIKLKNFTFKMIVTKLNGKLVKKNQRDDVYIKDGDDIMILHLISGG